jgi:hypothetical protein
LSGAARARHAVADCRIPHPPARASRSAKSRPRPPGARGAPVVGLRAPAGTVVIRHGLCRGSPFSAVCATVFGPALRAAAISHPNKAQLTRQNVLSLFGCGTPTATCPCGA